MSNQEIKQRLTDAYTTLIALELIIASAIPDGDAEKEHTYSLLNKGIEGIRGIVKAINEELK